MYVKNFMFTYILLAFVDFKYYRSDLYQLKADVLTVLAIYNMAPKYIRTLSSDVLKLSTRSWRKYSYFSIYLEKMTISLPVGDFERRVEQCGDVQSPHCSTMISHKTHAWVL